MLRSFLAAIVVCSVVSAPAKAAILQCSIQEWLKLSDDGLMKPDDTLPLLSQQRRQFMVNTENGQVIGYLFESVPTWTLRQASRKDFSLITIGSNSWNEPVRQLVVNTFLPANPFAILTLKGVVDILSGTCR